MATRKRVDPLPTEEAPGADHAAPAVSAGDGAAAAGRFDVVDLADLLGCAIIGLGPDRRVEWCSAAARAILTTANALRVEDGRLHAKWPQDDRQLTSAFMVAQGTKANAAIPIRFGRSHGQPELFGILRANGPGWVVLLADPTRSRDIDQTVWRQWFALTPKECELAFCLAQGWTTEQAAERLRVRHGTTGSHLKNIYLKMGLSRQPELVHLLTLLPVAKGGGDK